MSLFHVSESKSIVKKVQSFNEFVEDFQINTKDVVMKVFMRSLKDTAREWYESLPTQCISSWEDF